MEIEHVAGIGFAARRAAQQQRHLAIGHGLLGEIVIDDQRVHAVVAEELAHRAAGIGREELQRRRLGGRRGDDDRIVERAVILQRLDDLRDGRALLPDRDIDAIELLRFVVPALTPFWLRMVSMATAVLPVWRSPMISSRWPRPTGTSASIALSPVCTGSCTDLRGMMPGALTSTRVRFTSVAAPCRRSDCRDHRRRGRAALARPAPRRWRRCASPYRPRGCRCRRRTPRRRHCRSRG